jgi:transcription termination/antitermination protein NusA
VKSDFILAITQLSAEKNLPKEVVIAAVEAALVSAYRKEAFSLNQNISVKISPATGKVQVWAEMNVVERVSDPKSEISLAAARRIKPDAEIGQTVLVESTPANAGRIAAQTAKQVIMQRLHEAEHSAIIEEFAGREGTVVNGLIQRIEPRQILVDVGRTEAVLPPAEQVPGERYRIGQRLKMVILEVAKTPKGPRVVVSRTHPDLVRRLFEVEVPEIHAGIVEIRSIAREAGSRSKVAVAARQEGVDPVGCCVGLRGIRIQNIVSELNGEKIDVVAWNAEPGAFIASSLNPAQIVAVELNRTEGIATVIVPDRQLSLAIGKEGQNVRLAAKLTGWRIDIKSASVAEGERILTEAAKAATEAAQPSDKKEITIEAEELPEPEEAVTTAGTGTDIHEPKPTVVGALPEVVPSSTVGRPKETVKLRFAEDILLSPAKANTQKKKKKKKGAGGKESDEDAAGRRSRRGNVDYSVDDDQEF